MTLVRFCPASLWTANLNLPSGDSTLQFIEYLANRRGDRMRNRRTRVHSCDPHGDRPGAITNRLKAAKVRFLIPGKAPGKPRLALARDPDGFWVELAEADAAAARVASGNVVGIRLDQRFQAALRIYRGGISGRTQLGGCAPRTQPARMWQIQSEPSIVVA